MDMTGKHLLRQVTAISRRLEQHQIMTILTYVSQSFFPVKNVLKNKNNAQISEMTAFDEQIGNSLIIAKLLR